MRRPEDRIQECECEAQQNGFYFHDFDVYIHCRGCRKKLSVACMDEVAKAVEAACHYVPGMGFNPQFATYTKEELEAALARVAAAAAS